MLILPGQIKHGVLLCLRDGGLTTQQIVEALVAQGRTFISDTLVGKHLAPMCSIGLLDKQDRAYKLTIDGHMKLTALEAKAGRQDKALVTPGRTTSKLSGLYDGAELKRNPGTPAARFKAFDLPSVALGWRIWPDGRKEKVDA